MRSTKHATRNTQYTLRITHYVLRFTFYVSGAPAFADAVVALAAGFGRGGAEVGGFVLEGFVAEVRLFLAAQEEEDRAGHDGQQQPDRQTEEAGALRLSHVLHLLLDLLG